MANPAQNGYTFGHDVGDDGSVSFRCTQDSAAWRWLELPAYHPIYLQTFNYYISVECGAAREARDPSKWSALTWMDWEMGDPEAGLPTHGRMENRDDTDQLAFAMWLYDAQDRLVHRASGKGVVFRNRNFEGWREKAKDRLDARKEPPSFNFARREDVGAWDGEHSLIAPLVVGARETEALITYANGMPPGSRYLDGSGDHVNAVHLAEVARQFCALLTSDPDVRFSGGEISFTRYVEMNVPLNIKLDEQYDRELRMQVNQAGKPCTRLAYRVA